MKKQVAEGFAFLPPSLVPTAATKQLSMVWLAFLTGTPQHYLSCSHELALEGTNPANWVCALPAQKGRWGYKMALLSQHRCFTTKPVPSCGADDLHLCAHPGISPSESSGYAAVTKHNYYI